MIVLSGFKRTTVIGSRPLTRTTVYRNTLEIDWHGQVSTSRCVFNIYERFDEDFAASVYPSDSCIVWIVSNKIMSRRLVFRFNKTVPQPLVYPLVYFSSDRIKGNLLTWIYCFGGGTGRHRTIFIKFSCKRNNSSGVLKFNTKTENPLFVILSLFRSDV